MLRKKMSKLIVGIMAVTVLGGEVSRQAVHALNLQKSSIYTTNSESVEVNSSTKEQEIIDAINNLAVTSLNLNGQVNLTSNIVDALNNRTKPFSFIISDGGFLSITESINLDGTSSSLQIIRQADNNTSEMIVVGNGVDEVNSIQVSIKGVTFDNNGSNTSSIKNNLTLNTSDTNEETLLSTLDLQNNKVKTGVFVSGNLSENSVKNNTLIGGAIISSEQTYDISPSLYSGATTVTLSGNIEENIGIASGYIELVLNDQKDSSSTKQVPLEISDKSFSICVDGLTQSQQYNVVVNVVVEDKNGNSYSKESSQLEFTTIDFTSSVSNIGKNVVTINVDYGSLYRNNYPVTVVVNNKSYVLDDAQNSVLVYGLNPNTRYTYEIKDSTGNIIDRNTFKTLPSLVSGDVGDTILMESITDTDVNRATITDSTIYIPISDDGLFSRIKNSESLGINIEGVTVKLHNNGIQLSGLVPDKEYTGAILTYKDGNGTERKVSIFKFKTQVASDEIKQFVRDVYEYSLDRLPDERGFLYWVNSVMNKNITPQNFILNLLSEKEFIERYPTTEGKIEALYNVIVNRPSDSEGLNYWIERYDNLVDNGYSSVNALITVVDFMMNEREFKNRINSLGL